MSLENSLRSSTEVEVLWWLEELLEAGYIKDIQYESRTFLLFEGASYTKEIQLKTRTKVEERSLLQGCSYTPDFVITWDKSALGVFVSKNSLECPLYCNDSLISYLEVKPSFNHQNKRSFASLTIKWVYDKYNEFIQIITPYEAKSGRKSFLFKDTFTPKKFLFTPKTNKRKDLHYNLINLNEYLKTKL